MRSGKLLALLSFASTLIVISCQKGGDDNPNPPASTALAPFTSGTSSRQATSATLVWTASVNNNNSSPVKYKIQLGASIIVSDLTVTTYTITGLVATNSYSGKIFAYTSNGDTSSSVFSIGQYTATFPNYNYVTGYYKVTETTTLSSVTVGTFTFTGRLQLTNDSIINFTQSPRRPNTWWTVDFPTVIYPTLGDSLIGTGITPRGRILNPTTIRMGYLFGASAGVYDVKQIWTKLANPADSMLYAYNYPNFSLMITTFAGKSTSGTTGSTGDGGLATAAGLSFPNDIAVDAAGNIYFTEGGATFGVRKINIATGIITRYAGNYTSGFSGDGALAINAQLSSPQGLLFDNAGNLYISDGGNRVIRKVNSSGIISTIAGTPGVYGYSGDSGPATSAQLGFPAGMAFDANGNLYVADPGKHVIRRISTNGIISTAAGTGTAGYSGDGAAAISATLNTPTDVVFDASGIMYIADKDNNVIRKVTPGGVISTYAGIGGFSGAGFSGDGGLATSAKMNKPQSVSVDNNGNIYISDYSNNRIRKVTIAGIISTYAGNGQSTVMGAGPDFFGGDFGAATSAAVSAPYGNIWTSTGLYIVNSPHRIRKVKP